MGTEYNREYMDGTLRFSPGLTKQKKEKLKNRYTLIDLLSDWGKQEKDDLLAEFWSIINEQDIKLELAELNFIIEVVKENLNIPGNFEWNDLINSELTIVQESILKKIKGN